MIVDELTNTIEKMLVPGKGILAADESTNTIGKRLKSINQENTVENRQAYRDMLFNSPELENYINGVILFEETLSQQSLSGPTFAELLQKRDILPGIKVDKGLTDLPFCQNEKVTMGLDGLKERLEAYKEQGAVFAKWRNVYSISQTTPSQTAVRAGSEMLARYAAVCQSVGIVPIVEPEVLIDGDHSITHCAEATDYVLHELYDALFAHQVILEASILKPSMVISGSEAAKQSSSEEVAEYTLGVLRNQVPAAVPSINFLSGGQTPEQATEHLHLMNEGMNNPWLLSFSYGRALQEPSLKAWAGDKNNIEKAQNALTKRARLNSAASVGEYRTDME